jgi:hypothetical protein
VFTDSIWTVSSPIWTAGAAGVSDAPAVASNPSFAITPNPARAGSVLQVRVSGLGDTPASLAIFDVSGRIVSSLVIGHSELAIPSLPCGVYVVRLTSAGQAVSHKLVLR